MSVTVIICACLLAERGWMKVSQEHVTGRRATRIVVVDAGHGGVDQAASFFQILRFFIGSSLLIETFVFLSGHHHLNILLFQNSFQPFRNLQINILFQ